MDPSSYRWFSETTERIWSYYTPLERAYSQRVCTQNLGAVASVVPELCDFEDFISKNSRKTALQNGEKPW